ncbi:hypothetical protein NMG60_11023759 [Bertholletia excelsa]
MEAHKERQEQLEREDRAGTKKQSAQKFEARTTPGDPTAKAREVIRESLITGNGDGTEKENHEGAARDPDDVLAFSRTVNKVDSSLD